MSLLDSCQQCRAGKHHPLRLEVGHEFAVRGVDQFDPLVAHVPELPDKRLHVAILRLREDVVQGECAALLQCPQRLQQILLPVSRDVVIDVVL